MAHTRITIHDVSGIKVEAHRYGDMLGGFLEIWFLGAKGTEDTKIVAHAFDEEGFERLRQGAPRSVDQAPKAHSELQARSEPVQEEFPF